MTINDLEPIEIIMKNLNTIQLGQYTSKNNEIFSLSWWKWNEPIEADYRMYFVKVNHKSWGDKTYTVFITKKYYSQEKDAQDLVLNIILNEIKRRLEMAKDSHHLIDFTPINNEEWALV